MSQMQSGLGPGAILGFPPMPAALPSQQQALCATAFGGLPQAAFLPMPLMHNNNTAADLVSQLPPVGYVDPSKCDRLRFILVLAPL